MVLEVFRGSPITVLTRPLQTFNEWLRKDRIEEGDVLAPKPSKERDTEQVIILSTFVMQKSKDLEGKNKGKEQKNNRFCATIVYQRNSSDELVGEPRWMSKASLKADFYIKKKGYQRKVM